MLLSVLLQAAAAGVGVSKLGAAIGAGLAVIGAGVGIGKNRRFCHGGHCPSAGSIRRYPYEHDYCRCLD